MAVGAGVAVGLTDINDTARSQAERLTFGGGVLLVAIVAVSYLAGGYVAGRMARFDGWRNGLGVWILAIVMTAALAATAWIAGGDVNPLESLDLPRVPVEEDEGLTRGGVIALAATAVATLLAAIAGGVAGERFHRAVDDAGSDYGGEPEQSPVPDPEPRREDPDG
jgi:hypothetical protein